MGIRALLFDSGGTLVRPTAGSWLPGPHFESFAAGHGVGAEADPRAWAAALHAGNAVLASEPVVPTVADEVALFSQYFLIVGASLGLPTDPAAAARLADETVFGDGHEACYDGVPQMLQVLGDQGFRLLLLANGWPSLSRRYRALGLRDHFDFFVTSTQLGSKKPNPRAFRLVAEITNVEPADLLVVDDLAANILVAGQLGMPGLLVTHNGPPSTPNLEWTDGVAGLPGWMERSGIREPRARLG